MWQSRREGEEGECGEGQAGQRGGKRKEVMRGCRRARGTVWSESVRGLATVLETFGTSDPGNIPILFLHMCHGGCSYRNFD